MTINDTRWGSVFKTLHRYVEPHPILPSCAFPREVLHLIPDAAAIDKINEQLYIIKNCEEVSKFLRNEDSVNASLGMVRAAFDTWITDYPVLSKYLGANAEIVQ